jgi:hypothetical protein
MRLVSTAICAVALIARQAAPSSVLKGKVGNADRQEPCGGDFIVTLAKVDKNVSRVASGR